MNRTKPYAAEATGRSTGAAALPALQHLVELS